MSTDDLRARMRAVFSASKSAKSVLRCYSIDSAAKNGATDTSICNTTFPNENKAITPLHRFSANNRDSQPGKELAEPSVAYQAASAEPDGTGCNVEIVELPQAQRYRKVFAFLQLKPPALVDAVRWRQCVEDGKHFLAKWGEQAEALGWTSADLFGLHTPPERPHPSYNRLSRYDATGLCWLLQGRPVVALTESTAAIENPATGSITVYRKHNKPELGPLSDSLDDFK
jgi:hypothetical protein